MTVTMEELSAGVQKIFADAAGGTPSYPVETENIQNCPSNPNSPPSYVMLCYATGTVRLEEEEEEEEEENRLHEKSGAGGS
jgi:hypothetical protein